MSLVILCLWSPSAVLPKAKTSRTILNKNGQSGELYLVPCFSGRSLSFSHLSWCWQWIHFKLSLMCWVMLPISLFSLGLITEGSWILSKSISLSSKMIMWFMSFNLYIGLHVPNRYIESFMHFLDEAYMIMVNGVFWHVFGLSLQVFHWQLLHRCSWGKLVCNSLSYLGLYVTWVSVRGAVTL